MSSFLSEQEKKAKQAKQDKATEAEPPSETTATSLAARRHMTVILGSAIRQVDLPDNGQIPVDQPTSDSTGARAGRPRQRIGSLAAAGRRRVRGGPTEQLTPEPS